MSHIHTEPEQYDFTASAYIVKLGGTEPVLILHKHRKLNKYLQFGGHVELHESPWSAVAHEITEESGYDLSQLRILQPPVPPIKVTSGVAHPIPAVTLSIRFGDTDHFHTDIAYAFVTSEAPAHKIGEEESAETRVFTAGELAELPSSQIPADVREIGLYILQECIGRWVEVRSANFEKNNPAR